MSLGQKPFNSLLLTKVCKTSSSEGVHHHPSPVLTMSLLSSSGHRHPPTTSFMHLNTRSLNKALLIHDTIDDKINGIACMTESTGLPHTPSGNNPGICLLSESLVHKLWWWAVSGRTLAESGPLQVVFPSKPFSCPSLRGSSPPLSQCLHPHFCLDILTSTLTPAPADLLVNFSHYWRAP